MRTLRNKMTAGAAALLLATLGLAACSSDDTESGTPETGAPAATETGSADETEGVEAEEPDAPAGGEALTLEDFGARIAAAQLAAETVHVVQSSTATEGGTMEGDMRLSGDGDVALLTTSTLPDGTEQKMLLVDGVIYMFGGEAAGNKWVSFGSSDGDDDSELTDSFAPEDPQEQIEAMQDAIIEFTTEENAETIDGVSTTKLTMVLDTLTLMGESGQEMIDGGYMDETITTEMWVGPDDLPRRQVQTVAGVTSTTEYSRWGEPVDIAAPNPDDVIELSDLMQRQ